MKQQHSYRNNSAHLLLMHLHPQPPYTHIYSEEINVTAHIVGLSSLKYYKAKDGMSAALDLIVLVNIRERE